MKTFLQSVAQDLYSKIGNDLSRTAIVFPNKRASLFFNEYLAAQSDRPLWSPAYVNISELFRSLSPLKPGDPIRLVCELYKVFREETHSEEPLDDFYFWGELLISDFDDADKNLVDADKSVPESHFIPFEMYLSGFKYREIAERTGVSLGTIKSRIFHCRKKLKAILAE